jgi:hypothetical protein
MIGGGLSRSVLDEYLWLKYLEIKRKEKKRMEERDG